MNSDSPSFYFSVSDPQQEEEVEGPLTPLCQGSLATWMMHTKRIAVSQPRTACSSPYERPTAAFPEELTLAL
jgi:hypothetical protein